MCAMILPGVRMRHCSFFQLLQLQPNQFVGFSTKQRPPSLSLRVNENGRRAVPLRLRQVRQGKLAFQEEVSQPLTASRHAPRET